MASFVAVLCLLPTGGCRGERAQLARVPDDPAACARAQHELVGFVSQLPARALVSDLATELPESTLGTTPGPGALLEVSPAGLRYDGAPIRAAEVARTLAASPALVLHVAATPEVTIGELRAAVSSVPETTTLMLLVRTRSASDDGGHEQARSATPASHSERLLLERDHETRVVLAREGYRRHADCDALERALDSLSGTSATERWPSLKRALLGALPRCKCSELDAPGLESLIVAEQRAGSGALGALPLDFVRDRRCGATMPLRSVKRLLEQIEEFDADNAGRWEDDALRFEQVVNNERLLVQFCDALPGETLLSLARARATLYARLSGRGDCSGFAVVPLSPGAPMGTLRPLSRAAVSAYHYWQGAEELDIFGPVTDEPPSKPTDARAWTCRTRHRLTGIDSTGIDLDKGRFYFSDAACRSAAAGTELGGCLSGDSPSDGANGPAPGP